MRGELVEPVKPIEFYIDHAVPANILPYIKKGNTRLEQSF